MTKRQHEALKAVCAIARETGLPVRQAAVGRRLGVTKVTAHRMIQKLEALGFVARAAGTTGFVEPLLDAELAGASVLGHLRRAAVAVRDVLGPRLEEAAQEARAARENGTCVPLFLSATEFEMLQRALASAKEGLRAKRWEPLPG